MNGIFIIAHAPMASALKACAEHVFPDCASKGLVQVLDVQANVSSDETLSQAQVLMQQFGDLPVLILTDIFGATPCNVAQKLLDPHRCKLIAGANMPMVLRAVTYRHESLDLLLARAMSGATQGVMQVAISAPQIQTQKSTAHDPTNHYHQQ